MQCSTFSFYDRISKPMALAIDFSQGHMIYWADAKLNSIESMDEYGKNRHVIVAGSNGGFMRRPVAVDIFESEMYWANRDDGVIVRQVKVILILHLSILLLVQCSLDIATGLRQEG